MKARGDFRKLMQERFDKVNHSRFELTPEEEKRLAKLEWKAEQLRRRENVQNRHLQIWLSEDEYAEVEKA